MARSNRRRQDRRIPFLVFLIMSTAAWWLHMEAGLHPAASREAIAAVIVMAVLILIWRFRRDRAYRAALYRMGIRDPHGLNGVEYEKFCELILQEYGWRTSGTRSSGDFGADIVAVRRGIKMVVQCKRYRTPVGVKAVQEAHGAAAYYGAQRAAVMTCLGFTKAAHSLATKTGTTLIVVGDSDSMSAI